MKRYQLLERIDGGRGGFADVYRAVRTSDGAEVAVKILRDASDADARRAFAREVNIMKQLRHPHIVQLLDFDLNAPRPYYVMPLMRGGCLTEWAGRLSEAELRTVFMQIAGAVCHLHEKRALHRDLKLDNVLVSASGRVAIGDFGLGNRSDLTMILTVAAIGTPGYIAPELAGGAARATTASDIFSLGALLFHLLTGVHPNGTATLDPAIYAPSVADDLRQLVLEMTDTNPSARPSAAKVMRRLQPQERRREPESNSLVSIVAVGLLVLLGVGLVAAASD